MKTKNIRRRLEERVTDIDRRLLLEEAAELIDDSGRLPEELAEDIDRGRLPEELAADINRFTLERRICREVKYTAADVPALEREDAADLKRLEGLAADSLEAVRLREATRARSRKIEQLKKDENSVITETRTEKVPREKGIGGLEDFIRANWTIREIIRFNRFTHGGTYDAGQGWRIKYTGYVADTADGQRNLIRLFDWLKEEAFFYMGMKMHTEKPEKPATPPPPLLLTRFDADEESPLDMTPEALLRSIPNADGVGKLLAQIRMGVTFLVNDRKGKIEKNRKRGAENQAKGIDADRGRAAKDMDDALDRVRRKVKDKEKNGERATVLQVCRAVCKEFKWKTRKKNALGKCADGYYPLTGADGNEIKPETLAKNYRDRYGTKKKKAVAAK